MLKLAADENFNEDILSGVLLQDSAIDILRVRDAGLAGSDDPDVLAWAAREGRVLLTHDVNTMPNYAYERIHAGEVMPGVWVVPELLAVGRAIEDIQLIAEISRDGEWEGQVRYLPLR